MKFYIKRKPREYIKEGKKRTDIRRVEQREEQKMPKAPFIKFLSIRKWVIQFRCFDFKSSKTVQIKTGASKFQLLHHLIPRHSQVYEAQLSQAVHIKIFSFL